jgi:hypothetical protein
MARRPDPTSVTRHPSQLLNGADNGLHLVSAIAGLAIALWPANRTVPRRTGDRSPEPAAARTANPARKDTAHELQ